MTISKGKFQIGIDLGTTNTAAAIMTSNGIELLTLDTGNQLLPSCVYYDVKHREYVGIEAMNKMEQSGKRSGHNCFKQKMGSNYLFPIHNLDKNFLAEELSGAILRRIQNVFKRKYGEQLYTGIVTVPARFRLDACDATRVAGMGRYRDQNNQPKITFDKESSQYADFLYVETLMEPIAASLAYGLNSQLKDNSSWLVYDLGGGTFDAVVVRYIDGKMEIVCSDGDEHLGGHNFDKLIYTHIKKELNLLPPSGATKTKLEFMIEDTKKLLSRQKEASLDLPRLGLKDNRNNQIKKPFNITRDEYNSIVGPKFRRTLNIVSNMLRKEGIDSTSLDRVILVGGPTQYPYFRSQIQQELSIEVDYSINPMTAVAEGAAIKAASTAPKEVEKDIIYILSQKPHDCQIELNHESKTTESTSLVTGQIHANGLGIEQIASISFIREDGGWESGVIPVDEEGFFVSDVALRDGPNEFKVSISGHGSLQIIPSQESFPIFKGISTVGITPHSLNVTLQDGSSNVVISKGEAFEAQGRGIFHTTEIIHRNTRYRDLRTLIDRLEYGQNEPKAFQKDMVESLSKIREYEMNFRTEKNRPDNDAWDQSFNTCQRLIGSVINHAQGQTEGTFDDKKQELLSTVTELQKEASDYSILYIEITEGESNQAKDNFPVGKLVIPSTELRRDLPIDTELQVEIKQSADRRIFASCFVPYTRQTYQGVMEFDRSEVKPSQILSDYFELDYGNATKNQELEQFGSETQRLKYEELGLSEELDRIQAMVNEKGLQANEQLDEEQYDELKELTTVLTEMKGKIEDFEKDFIYGRIEGRLEYLDTVKKSGGELEQNIPSWRMRLAEARAEESFEKAKILEKDLKRFDKGQLGMTLLHYLYGFSNTRENEFIKILNDALGVLRKLINDQINQLNQNPMLRYSSNIIEVINQNQKELDKLVAFIPYFDEMHKKGHFPMLNKIYRGMGTLAKSVFEKMEQGHKYPVRDSDQIGEIFNRFASRWDKKILAELTKTTPHEELLKKAKRTAELWHKDKIEDCMDMLHQVLDLFWFDEQTTKMIGSQPNTAQTAPPLTTK